MSNNGAAYAKQNSANRTQVATNNRQQAQSKMRPAYVSNQNQNQNQNQSSQIRMASRPTNNNQSSTNNGNNTQSRPIMW
jgi:hypothetical protein